MNFGTGVLGWISGKRFRSRCHVFEPCGVYWLDASKIAGISLGRVSF